MIVRTWHGCVPLKHAEGFSAHLQKTGGEHAKGTPGNKGAAVRRETQGDWEHFFLTTWWECLDAVKAFAGDIQEGNTVTVAHMDVGRRVLSGVILITLLF
ncbi:heme-degrading monooxygenase HmoA [Erwinia rhapontici]|nr:heme-degrading monooxygenase HmoA [Erwinia rhapontici]